MSEHDTFEAGPGTVERSPDRCRSGHVLGPPVRGIVRAQVGSPTCTCTQVTDSRWNASMGHHRTWRCLKPGCPTPVLRRGPCDLDPADVETWRPTTPA